MGRFDLNEDIVVISNLLEQDGSIDPYVHNKLVVFLVNIERDTAPLRQSNSSTGGERIVISNPPVYLNLYLMFAGCFGGKNYPQALKFISTTISFFQKTPVFDHHIMPDLDDRIEKLVLNIENLNTQDLSNLWGILSGRYLPSILYKVRMVAFDKIDVRMQTPPIIQQKTSAKL
jgi:hypothetical protein